MKKNICKFIVGVMILGTCACNRTDNLTVTTPTVAADTTTTYVEKPTETVATEPTTTVKEEQTSSIVESTTVADTTPVIKKDIVPVVRGILAAGNGFIVGVGADGKAVVIQADTLAGIELGEVTAWDELISVAACDYDVIGLKNDGTVCSLNLSLGSWSDIVQVAVGKDNVAGLKNDGTVEYKGMTRIAEIKEWTDIIQVTAGDGFVAGLRSDKTVVSAGENRFGQCETNNWTDVEMLAAGEGHTVGIRSNGTVLAAGLNFFGECDVTSWTDIIYVAAGKFITIGIKSDGSMVITGLNADKYIDDLSAWTDMVSVSVNAGVITGVTSSGNVVISSIEEYPDTASLSVTVPQSNVVIDSKKELAAVEQKYVMDMNVIKPESIKMEDNIIKTEDGLSLELEEELADKIFCAVTEYGIAAYLKADVGIYLYENDIRYEYAELGYFNRLSMKEALTALVAEVQPTWLVGDEAVRKQVNDSFIKVMTDICTATGAENTYKDYKLINDDGSVSIDNSSAGLLLENIDKFEAEEVYVYVFSTATDYQIRNDENQQEYWEVQDKLIDSVAY